MLKYSRHTQSTHTANPHTLQSTYSWSNSRSSQTPCHILDRHRCIEYTKTLKTKDTCTQTRLAHVHTGTHTHPQCVLTFCMRVPLPHCLLSPPCWPADMAKAKASLTKAQHLDWILRTERWQCREAGSGCHRLSQAARLPWQPVGHLKGLWAGVLSRGILLTRLSPQPGRETQGALISTPSTPPLLSPDKASQGCIRAAEREEALGREGWGQAGGVIGGAGSRLGGRLGGGAV